MKYEKAIADLEKIMHDVENGQLNLDELTEKLKTAKELLALCNERLNATEEDIKKILTKE